MFLCLHPPFHPYIMFAFPAPPYTGLIAFPVSHPLDLE